MTDGAAGWQADPTGRFEHRYWDGSQWTDHVSNAGVASTDAFAAAAAESTSPAAPEPTPPEPTTPVDEAPGWGDPTTTQPVSAGETTSVWPAAPGLTPPIPPLPPTGDALGAASSGSKKGLMIGAAALAAVAVVVAGLLLTGGNKDGDRERIRTELAAQINDGGQLSKDQANCIADAIIDEVGVEKLKDVDFTASEPPAAIADELTAAAFGSLAKCNVDASDLVGATDTTDASTAASDGTSGSGAELPADFEQQLATIYEKNMGLPGAKARCLAGKIRAAIRSGALSQDQAMSDIFGYFAACNIDMSEFKGN
jgi:hypothetical protein